jgi:hypothetical protein
MDGFCRSIITGSSRPCPRQRWQPYDREHRLTAISGTGTSAGFVYDAEDNRVKSTVNGVTALYIAGIYEQQGTATTHYQEGNGQWRTRYAADNGVFYRLTDYLSSTLVTQSGAVSGASAKTSNVFGALRGIPGIGAGESPNTTWRRPFSECCITTEQAACNCTRD